MMARKIREHPPPPVQVHVPENFARGSPPRHGEVGFRVAMRLYTLALYPALYPPIPQYALCCVFGVRFFCYRNHKSATVVASRQ